MRSEKKKEGREGLSETNQLLDITGIIQTALPRIFDRPEHSHRQIKRSRSLTHQREEETIHKKDQEPEVLKQQK